MHTSTDKVGLYKTFRPYIQLPNTLYTSGPEVQNNVCPAGFDPTLPFCALILCLKRNAYSEPSYIGSM